MDKISGISVNLWLNTLVRHCLQKHAAQPLTLITPVEGYLFATRYSSISVGPAELGEHKKSFEITK